MFDLTNLLNSFLGYTQINVFLRKQAISPA